VPQLGVGVTPLRGMAVEAGLSAYTCALMLLLPNWLAARGLPPFLFLGAMMPAMKVLLHSQPLARRCVGSFGNIFLAH
jgi:hypothetical protein